MSRTVSPSTAGRWVEEERIDDRHSTNECAASDCHLKREVQNDRGGKREDEHRGDDGEYEVVPRRRLTRQQLLDVLSAETVWSVSSGTQRCSPPTAYYLISNI